MPLPGHIFSDYFDSMPDDMRKGRRDFMMKVIMVPHQTPMSLYACTAAVAVTVAVVLVLCYLYAAGKD